METKLGFHGLGTPPNKMPSLPRWFPHLPWLPKKSLVCPMIRCFNYLPLQQQQQQEGHGIFWQGKKRLVHIYSPPPPPPPPLLKKKS